MGYPRDPKLKGLAAVTYHPEHLSWEYDIRAVMPESNETPRVSDWHRRHGRANRKDSNIERAAEALRPVDGQEPSAEAACRKHSGDHDR